MIDMKRCNMKVYQIFLAIALVLLPLQNGFSQVSGFDQVGTTSFQFLQVVPNAHAAGMGSASSTTIFSSDATFFNPAGLTQTSKMDATVSYLDWFMDVTISSVSLSYQLKNYGTIGFHGMVTDYGELVETRVDQLQRDPITGIYNPGLTGNSISASAMVFGLSFARELTDRFSFGLTAKLAHEDLVAKSVSALIFDGGMLYKTGYKSLKLGVMVRNFGADITYFEESYPLPQTFAIGVSGLIVGNEAEGMLFNSNDSKVLMSYELVQTRDHSQQQHLGMEYSFNDLIFLRGGYIFNYDEESWTAGFGLAYNRFRLDYAYNDFGDFLGNTQRFTFNLLIQ